MAERELETERQQDQIEIAVEVNFNMHIDIHQIKQALHNLIANGLYYSGLQVGQRRLRLSAHLNNLLGYCRTPVTVRRRIGSTIGTMVKFTEASGRTGVQVHKPFFFFPAVRV